MPQFVLGPNITPSTGNQAQTFGVTVPFGVLNKKGNIVGWLVENFSAFGATFIGENLFFHLWPYSGVYIPTGPFIITSVTTDPMPISSSGQARPLTAFDVNTPGFHAFFDSDLDIPEPYRVYSLVSPTGQLRSNKLNFVSITSLPANSSGAHTITLGPFAVSSLPGGGLYLTHIAFMFGNPSSAAAGDVSLTDISNATIMNWHLNLTVAGPQVHVDDSFTDPIAGNVNAGNAQFNFVQPGFTNGPGYSITMIGFIV
jgi:hypothetical protein